MESHLLQMRGLKLATGQQNGVISTVSHLLQMRGLKLAKLANRTGRRKVASFTDAWIETTSPNVNANVLLCRIFYRCVDWNAIVCEADTACERSHLLQMRGLKPLLKLLPNLCLSRIFYRCKLLKRGSGLHFPASAGPGRIFYRCVDWNSCWWPFRSNV